ncbi:MAG: (2Fe-2S)-binding protein [Oscillochloris sp.]|nr:(2Fe-2S)-binding protein [Oscillochloris sp.]
MPTVIINDVPMEARLGERLLDVARRNGAHIGFVCDGTAVCQTCQCRVLSGAEYLNPPNEAEKIWMPEQRLNDGNRLACQAALRGRGTVQILTTVEELRRQTLDVLAPPPGESGVNNLGPLLEHWLRLNVDQLAHFPFNIIRTLNRVGPARFLFPWQDVSAWVNDGVRAAAATTRDGGPSARAPVELPQPPSEARIRAALREVEAASRETARRRGV